MILRIYNTSITMRISKTKRKNLLNYSLKHPWIYHMTFTCVLGSIHMPHYQSSAMIVFSLKETDFT